jgi:ABC-type phosphate/phosphonate transport system substrate-binding protein
MHLLTRLSAALLLVILIATATVAEEASSGSGLVIVVMDPLAKPLSCPCVAGYAQRDYEKLATAMKSVLKRDVTVVFNESLVSALKKNSQADLIIGKQSVILHDAKRADMQLKKVAMLSGLDGKTTQRGLVVVPAEDPAKKVSDLKDYRMFFGPAECDEKHAAALRLLKEHGVESPAKLETAAACDEGAVNILELAPKGVRGCAVISSYAKPLLEGCGQVPKGALRVVGETEEVPFIAAYVNASLNNQLQTALAEGLLKSTATDFALRKALETKSGFVGEDEAGFDVAKKK